MKHAPRSRPLSAACLLAAAALAGCDDSGGSGSDAPNVLLILIDTLRSDHLGCYGYDRPVSPRIDALAARGVVFENAISTSSWTLPAHASMLTGRYPSFHGLQDDGVRLPPAVPTLAESFRARGYHSLAVVSHVYVSSQFGLDRGFDEFDDSLIAGGAANPAAEEVIDRFLELVPLEPDRPFFGFVHLFDPHWSYAAPEPFGSRFVDPAYTGPIDGTLPTLMDYFERDHPMSPADLAHTIALYDGEIAYVDHQVGRLLDAFERRGMIDDTVVVITSDHGEEFKEHGGLGHGRTLFGEQLRVPLIVAGHPAFPAGTRRTDLVSPIDLAPTLLALGDGPDAEAQGESIVDAGRDDRVLLAESLRFGNELRAIQGARFKLIHQLDGDRRLFFDLAADPLEQQPARDDPTGGDLSAALAGYAELADSGWHLKLIAVEPQPLRCTGRVSTVGRLVRPRRYFSQHIQGMGRAEFLSYEAAPDGRSLSFDLVIGGLIGEVTFETDPPDAPVTVEVTVSGAANAGVFAGTGEPLANGAPVTLQRSDPRLQGVPPSYVDAAPGCYVRTVIPPEASAQRTDLSEAAIERLRSLGYVDAGR